MSAAEINSELLKCGLCGGELGLVAQVQLLCLVFIQDTTLPHFTFSPI